MDKIESGFCVGTAVKTALCVDEDFTRSLVSGDGRCSGTSAVVALLLRTDAWCTNLTLSRNSSWSLHTQGLTDMCSRLFPLRMAHLLTLETRQGRILVAWGVGTDTVQTSLLSCALATRRLAGRKRAFCKHTHMLLSLMGRRANFSDLGFCGLEEPSQRR